MNKEVYKFQNLYLICLKNNIKILNKILYKLKYVFIYTFNIIPNKNFYVLYFISKFIIRPFLLSQFSVKKV
jgi:hypothetical protein